MDIRMALLCTRFKVEIRINWALTIKCYLLELVLFLKMLLVLKIKFVKKKNNKEKILKSKIDRIMTRVGKVDNSKLSGFCSLITISLPFI